MYYIRYLQLLTLFLISHLAFGSHEGLGLEINSKFLSASNQHVIVVKHYRDSLIPANPSLNLNTFSTCGNSNSSIMYSYSDTLETNCSAEKIFVHHYIDTLSLPSSCRNYSFDVAICCIQGSVSRSGTLFAKLRFTNDSLANNSPVFNRNQFIYASINDTSIFDFSAYDSNGDSLSYELYRNSQFTGYLLGYNRLNPFGQNAYTQLNSSTGALTFKPNNSGKYFITIKVNEYRNGNLIGFVTKDIACIVSSTGLNRSLTWSNPSVLNNVCVGDSISLFGSISGSQSSSLLVSKFNDSSLASIVNSGNSVGFNWIVQAIDSGIKTFNIFIEDGNCNVKSTLLSVNVANCMTTGLTENRNSLFEMFPNPTTEILFFSFKKASKYQLEILDMGGKIIDSFTINGLSAEYNVTNIEGGFYFVRLIKEGEIEVRKFAVIK